MTFEAFYYSLLNKLLYFCCKSYCSQADFYHRVKANTQAWQVSYPTDEALGSMTPTQCGNTVYIPGDTVSPGPPQRLQGAIPSWHLRIALLILPSAPVRARADSKDSFP